MGERAWMTAAGALALVVFLSLAAPDAGINLPPGDRFSPAASPAVQVIGPAVGAPGGVGWLGSTQLSQLALLLPVGAPTARLGALAIVAGLLTVALTFRLYRRLTLSAPSALIGAAVVATGGTVLSLVTSGSPDAVLAPLVPGLLLCELWWMDTRRPAALGVLVGVTVLGVGSYPVLLVVVCGVVAAIAVSSAQNRLWPLAAAVGAAVLGLVHRAVATLLAASTAAEGIRSVPGTEPVAMWSSSVVLGAPRVDAILDRLASAGSVVIGELGLLGMLLAMVGLTALVRRSRARGLTWSWAFAMVWLVVWLSATPAGGPRVAALLSWLVVGAGIDWIWRSSETLGARAGAVAVGVVVAGASLASHVADTAWSTGLGGATYGHRLREALPAGTGLVAERPGLDRALGAATAADGAALPRLPLRPSVVKRLHENGQQVAALAGARERLEQLGLQFEAVSVRPERVTVSRMLRALPRGSIVAAAGGPGLNRAIMPDTGALFGDVGGVADLFGQGGAFYGVIGVAHQDGLAYERRSATGVVLELGIGDPVGSFPVRAMSALRVTSDRDGGRVELDGRLVARARTGLALIALTPAGRPLTTVADELDDGLEIPVPAAGEPVVARVVGWEPCATVPAGRWVDVGAEAASGGLGALVTGAGALVVYATGPADRPVSVQPVDAAAAGGAVVGYRPAEPDQRVALRNRLEADQAPFGAVLLDAPHVWRLELAVPGALAVELGAAPPAAYARYDAGVGGAGAVDVCGMVSGQPRFDLGAPVVTTVDVGSLQTSGWGWHDLEQDTGGLFRWSDGVETAQLVQLVRTGPIRVEIDASAAAVDLTDAPVTTTLVVNGTPFPSLEMARDVRTYVWRVPAAAWKTGMNRVGLRVSDAVSPSALGIGDDDRILGIALRRLELTLGGT